MQIPKAVNVLQRTFSLPSLARVLEPQPILESFPADW
jgi:hypothetical protein